MPAVSIIVPVYNAEQKICRCIDSILNQIFKDFELLLIDDGSPDNCGKICDEYAKKDSRIKVIHQSNAGASAARNAGIKTAKGEYIGFVDSDDYVIDNYLDSLFTIVQNSNADIAVCNYFQSVGEEKPIKMCHGFDEGTVFDQKDIKSTIYKNIFKNKHTVGYSQLWNKLFRRSLIIGNNITLNRDMSFGEDMLFVMDSLKFCESIAFTENAGYYYEMTESGLFSRYNRGFINDITMCYSSLIEQTAPDNYTQKDLLPLNIKYWNYINRQIGGIAKNEKYIFAEIRKVFKDKTVKKIFSEISNLSTEQANDIGIAQNELKPARLLSKGFISIAAFVADYQFNENFWLRRLKK